MPSKDVSQLVSYLYVGSQQEDSHEDPEVYEDLCRIFDALKDIERVEMNSKPLEDALKELGIDPEVYTVPSGSRLAINFADADGYGKACTILQDPTNLTHLADLGWVASMGGDHSGNGDSPQYVINFINMSNPLDVDEPSGDNVDLDQLVKDAQELGDASVTEPLGDKGAVEYK